MPHSWHLPSVVGLNPSALNTDAPKRQREVYPESMGDGPFHATLYNAVTENRRPKLVFATSSSYGKPIRRGVTNVDAFGLDERQLKIATAIDQAFRFLEIDLYTGTDYPYHFILKELQTAHFAQNAVDLNDDDVSFVTLLMLHSIVNNENEWPYVEETIIDKVDLQMNPNRDFNKRAWERRVAANRVSDFKEALKNVYISLTNAHVVDSTKHVVDREEVLTVLNEIGYKVGVPRPVTAENAGQESP